MTKRKYPGLRVVDISVLPHHVATNTQAPAMAVRLDRRWPRPRRFVTPVQGLSPTQVARPALHLLGSLLHVLFNRRRRRDERVADCELDHASFRKGRVRFGPMRTGGLRAISKLHESGVVARPKVARVRTRSVLTANEIAELQRLFDLIADTCDAGNIVLVNGSELKRLRDLAERVDALLNGAKSVLGCSSFARIREVGRPIFRPACVPWLKPLE